MTPSRVAVLLLAFVACALAQTYPVSPNATTATCTYPMGSCATWAYNSTIGAYDSGNNIGNQSINNELKFLINIPIGYYLTIDFQYMVSSELNYDMLQYQTDNTVQQSFSGNQLTWTTVSYTTKYNWAPYNPGNHTVIFRYTKDSAREQGQDRAWVRNINFKLVNLTCFGVGQGDDNVCSGHGVCNPTATPGVGTCTCDTNYFGADCRTPLTCNGNGLNSTQCSNQGVCNKLPYNNGTGTCTCVAGVYGKDCEQTLTCNNVTWNNAQVCSGRGSCSAAYSNATGVCSCATNYYGSNCQTALTCDGILSSNPTVCSGHGTCSGLVYKNGTGVCQCSANWYGSQCSTPLTCNGTAYNAYGTVCSNHGSCYPIDSTSFGQCYCNGNFYGQICENPVMCNSAAGPYSVPATDPTACSSNVSGGYCNGNSINGTCVCYQKRYGSYCQKKLNCNGVDYDQPNRCSGAGTCNAAYGNETGVCICNSGYYGADCSVVLNCGGINYNNYSYVCTDSSRGTCQLVSQGNPNGKCVCGNNYNGTYCERFRQCYGIDYNNASVCSGQGTCYRDTNGGYCYCNSGSYGDQCQTPTTCFGIAHYNTTYVCSNAGSCISPYNNATGACSCQSYAYGQQCENPIQCYGITWNNYSSVCTKSQGYCRANTSNPSQGICTCYGYYYGQQCEKVATCAGISAANTSYVCGGPTKSTGCGAPVDPINGNATCTCIYPYTGPDCSDQFKCGNYSVLDPQVCSSVGKCIRANNVQSCKCNFPYYGANCELSPNLAVRTFASYALGNSYSAWNYNGEFFDSGGLAPLNSYSTLEFNFTVAPNDFVALQFEYLVSTYPYAALSYMTFSLDGKLINNYGDTNSQWLQLRTYNISSGNHVVRWQYYKYYISGYGTDRAYIRNISFINNITCNGVSNKDPTVCSANGLCTMNNTGYGICSCNQYYFTADCGKVINCNQLSIFDPNVCGGSTHGTCKQTSPGFGACQCKSPYTGVGCDVLMSCNGVAANDPSVCSAHGSCGYAPDGITIACSCQAPYYGADCSQVTSCAGILGTDPTVCSGHGTCYGTTASGTCSCNSGWQGSQCSVPISSPATTTIAPTTTIKPTTTVTPTTTVQPTTTTKTPVVTLFPGSASSVGISLALLLAVFVMYL